MSVHDRPEYAYFDVIAILPAIEDGFIEFEQAS
jgi:hypothetical protein